MWDTSQFWFFWWRTLPLLSTQPSQFKVVVSLPQLLDPCIASLPKATWSSKFHSTYYTGDLSVTTITTPWFLLLHVESLAWIYQAYICIYMYSWSLYMLISNHVGTRSLQLHCARDHESAWWTWCMQDNMQHGEGEAIVNLCILKEVN